MILDRFDQNHRDLAFVGAPSKRGRNALHPKALYWREIA
jgi:hypothetical protein